MRHISNSMSHSRQAAPLAEQLSLRSQWNNAKKANDFHWISTNGHWTGRIHSALSPHLNNATVLHCHSVHNVQNVNKLLSFLFSSSPFLSRSSSCKLLFRLFTFQECISFKFVPAFYFYLWLHKNPLHQPKLKRIQNVANNRF